VSACACTVTAARSCSPAVEVEKHPVGIIIRSHAPPKGIRFEISRDHWRSEPAVHATLPERVIGKIEQWRNKALGKLHIEWKSDGSNSDEHLAVLLRPSLGLKLLPYADNRSAPKAKGSAAKRAYAEVIARGPYAATEGVEEQQVRYAGSLRGLLTPLYVLPPTAALAKITGAGGVRGGRRETHTDLGCPWADFYQGGLAPG
jgi:hypothetical protein